MFRHGTPMKKNGSFSQDKRGSEQFQADFISLKNVGSKKIQEEGAKG